MYRYPEQGLFRDLAQLYLIQRTVSFQVSNTTYRGRALIAVRAGYEEGEIHVSVSTDGISEQTIRIQVKGEE